MTDLERKSLVSLRMLHLSFFPTERLLKHSGMEVLGLLARLQPSVGPVCLWLGPSPSSSQVLSLWHCCWDPIAGLSHGAIRF